MMIVYKTTLKPYFKIFHQEERKKKINMILMHSDGSMNEDDWYYSCHEFCIYREIPINYIHCIQLCLHMPN